MRSIIVTLAALTIFPTLATAETPSSIKEIGTCMAYYAVINGLDGNKQVDAGTTAIMRDLGSKLYEEGDKAKMTQAQVQDAVVAELLRVNAQAKQEGIEKATADMADGCDRMVSSIRGIQ